MKREICRIKRSGSENREWTEWWEGYYPLGAKVRWNVEICDECGEEIDLVYFRPSMLDEESDDEIEQIVAEYRERHRCP
jgi:hypothetical protein